MKGLWFGTAALALLAGPALAQQGTFESGSTGVDGALTFAANAGVIDFDPDDVARYGRVLDEDRDSTFHFTTISIGANTTVRLRTTHFVEGRPVVWLASGDVTIAGTLDLDGVNGHAWNQTFDHAHAGAGGYRGGIGNAPGTAAQSGNGPGGGGAGNGGAPWGANAGHAILGGVNSQPDGGSVYGNVHLRPMVGGSGGGGSLIWNGRVGSGGGGGGGAIVIASSSSINVLGVIRARGGNGGPRFDGIAAGGGGGSGGAVRLIAPTVLATGSISVAGGSAEVGTVAGHGRVRVESFKSPTTLTVIPGQALARSAPSAVFLPATAPFVKVVRVAGVAVAADPTGSFVVPDVAITSIGSVTVELEARNVPAGTVLSLTFQPESASQFTASSTPLSAGAGGVLTATASAVFQAGYTRVFVRANWTP